MSDHVQRDLVASLTARAVSGGLQFMFTPVYVALVGIESYGLVGFYLVLIGTLLFLDQAVSPTVTRQFATAAHSGPLRERLPKVLRTMEWLSIGTGLTVAAVVGIAAPALVEALLNPTKLPAGHVVVAVRVMALMIAFQWPSFAYAGALSGLGMQLQLNAVRAITALVQWVGGALILYIQRDVLALLIWQAICMAIQTAALAVLVHGNVRRQSVAPAHFDRGVLGESWRFALGSLIIGITGTILTQADKIVVMRHSTLADFSVYSLTFTIASTIQVFVAQPVMAIAYPRLARLYALGDEKRLAIEYGNWTQAVVFIVLPITAVLVFFPEPLLRLWLADNADAIEKCRHYVPIVAIGTMLNVIMMLPFNLQLASGWTSLSSTKNLLIVPPFLLALFVAIPRYGPIVGAICWFLINLSYYLIEVPIMHRRLLKASLARWWFSYTLAPTLITAGLSGMIYAASSTNDIAREHLAASAVASTLLCIVSLALILPFVRSYLGYVFKLASRTLR